jgi:phosphoribosylaminoimidazolecarboxamide formyltransferase/IMP cyclohydrolase
MALERYAFMSAYEKAGAADLAHALVEADYQIVSMGGTGQVVIDEGLPAITPLEFLNDPELEAKIAPMEDRAGRDVVADRLTYLMSERAYILRAAGQRALDLVYVNPMPPRELPDGGIKMDTGGITMIDAAVEGGRAVLTRPSQIECVVAQLSITGRIDHFTQAELLEDAMVYSQIYTGAVHKASQLKQKDDPKDRPF